MRTQPSFCMREKKNSNVAGAAGFEPTNHGVKVRCLAAWLCPYGGTRCKTALLIRKLPRKFFDRRQDKNGEMSMKCYRCCLNVAALNISAASSMSDSSVNAENDTRNVLSAYSFEYPIAMTAVLG